MVVVIYVAIFCLGAVLAGGLVFWLLMRPKTWVENLMKDIDKAKEPEGWVVKDLPEVEKKPQRGRRVTADQNAIAQDFLTEKRSSTIREN